MNKYKSLNDYKSNPFIYNQIKIAQKTLQMNDIFVNLMGGPTKEESREILKKYNIKIED